MAVIPTHKITLIALILILILAVALSLMIGSYGFAPFSIYHQFLNGSAILHYRFCRVILAVIAGSSLAASGVSLQALFRNPLADPHLFGISGGAALGAAIVIGFLSDSGSIMPSAGAMLGGLCAFLVVLLYLESARHENLGHCLLVGVLINSIAAAAITLIETIMPMHKTQSLLFWLVGHLSIVEPAQFLVVIPLWLLGMGGLWLIRGELEILSFGIEESRVLGINAHRIVKIAIIANCILIGNVVAFAGMIGFLGLVVPHLMRLTITADVRMLLPLASVASAILLVLFDSLSRWSFLMIKSEVPTGALAAVFLSPLLFVLLLEKFSHD